MKKQSFITKPRMITLGLVIIGGIIANIGTAPVVSKYNELKNKMNKGA